MAMPAPPALIANPVQNGIASINLRHQRHSQLMCCCIDSRSSRVVPDTTRTDTLCNMIGALRKVQ